jgi:hypothetical protein
MSQQESIHALFNQLAIVLGRADLLRIQNHDSTSQEAASLIKMAALRMQSLIQQMTDGGNEGRFSPQLGPKKPENDWSTGKRQECVSAGAPDVASQS